MRYLLFVALTSLLSLCFSCQQNKSEIQELKIIATGQMPNMVTDHAGILHMALGTNDSIMYISSIDGITFSSPVLVGILPQLAASHTRGPQIAATEQGLTIVASNTQGDIFTYFNKQGNWMKGARVNDVDTTSKEGLMALSGHGKRLYAVWLDLRDRHNKIFGAGSTDGGQTWSKNILVYASPDSTVCECCKPSVLIKADNVYVMFRNWLSGNRDLHLIQSNDGGFQFKDAQKLGTGSWALKGCPMDGGAIAVSDKNLVQTVWNRKGKIYACEPGTQEKEIGEGKGCTMEVVGKNNVYAWVEKGEVVCLLPKTGKQVLGKGRFPVLKSIGNNQVLCVWENEHQIVGKVLSL